MSSTMFSALPASANVFLYDADGDAIMTDAMTGLPIGFAGHVRARSLSAETEALDAASSHSSEEEGEVRSPRGTLVASPISGKGADATPPSTPKKAAREAEHAEEDGADGVARNLANDMAEAVLHGEPREDAPLVPPPGAEPAVEEWCVSVKVSDLALQLDMRHPRVLLNLLRFVETYNELAPPGETIRLPLIPQDRADFILSHESIVDPVPEFTAEVAELRSLMERYTVLNDDDDDDRYSTDSEDRRDRYRRSYYD